MFIFDFSNNNGIIIKVNLFNIKVRENEIKNLLKLLNVNDIFNRFEDQDWKSRFFDLKFIRNNGGKLWMF